MKPTAHRFEEEDVVKKNFKRLQKMVEQKEK